MVKWIVVGAIYIMSGHGVKHLMQHFGHAVLIVGFCPEAGVFFYFRVRIFHSKTIGGGLHHLQVVEVISKHEGLIP